MVRCWETATYGKIWNNEDVHDIGSIETEFPAIVFNDALTSEAPLSYEPTVSSLKDEIDFRISFDESDNEDYMVIFDKNSFSYKKISAKDLKTGSKNNNDKVNMTLLPSPEPTVSYFDDLDFFKDFENQFPAIVYNDARASKSDFLAEPTFCTQHIDEFDLKEETSLSEYDKEEQNVSNFNDLFSLTQFIPMIQNRIRTMMMIKSILNALRGIYLSNQAAVLAKSSSQPKSTYVAAASLSEFELMKILMDKMEEHKSYLCADYKRELYDALVRSYNTDKDLFETYGNAFTLKRSREDKDQDPSARLDRGTKRRKSSKEAGSSKDPMSNESKSSSSPKGTSRSQHRPSEKSAHAMEPRDTFDDSGVQQNQEFDTGNNDEQPIVKAASKSLVKVVYDKHAYWGISHWGLKRQWFYGFACNRTSTHDVYSRKQIIADTRLKIVKWYDYSHLDEIEVCREDQQLYMFKEGLRMDYLPKKRWNRLKKRRARVMIRDIDKQLRDKRLMRSLEKFVGGREYREDPRLLERTI
nr:hypothetical protein [Tanacetum cinerariifolium]